MDLPEKTLNPPVPIISFAESMGVVVILLCIFFFYAYCQFLLARKLKINKPWMAFVPVVSVYQLVRIVGWDPKLFSLFFIPGLNIFIIIYFLFTFATRFRQNPFIFIVLYPIQFPLFCFSYNPEKETPLVAKRNLLERLLNTPQSEFLDPNNPNPQKRISAEENDLSKQVVGGDNIVRIPELNSQADSEQKQNEEDGAISVSPALKTTVLKKTEFSHKGILATERDPFADAEKIAQENEGSAKKPTITAPVSGKFAIPLRTKPKEESVSSSSSGGTLPVPISSPVSDSVRAETPVSMPASPPAIPSDLKINTSSVISPGSSVSPSTEEYTPPPVKVPSRTIPLSPKQQLAKNEESAKNSIVVGGGGKKLPAPILSHKNIVSPQDTNNPPV